MKVLVIWEEIPDETSFLKLEVDNSQEEVLKLFHGNYINGEFDDISEEISRFFYKDPTEYLKFPKEQGYIECEKFDLIIRTGIIN